MKPFAFRKASGLVITTEPQKGSTGYRLSITCTTFLTPKLCPNKAS